MSMCYKCTQTIYRRIVRSFYLEMKLELTCPKENEFNEKSIPGLFVNGSVCDKN